MRRDAGAGFHSGVGARVHACLCWMAQMPQSQSPPGDQSALKTASDDADYDEVTRTTTTHFILFLSTTFSAENEDDDNTAVALADRKEAIYQRKPRLGGRRAGGTVIKLGKSTSTSTRYDGDLGIAAMQKIDDFDLTFTLSCIITIGVLGEAQHQTGNRRSRNSLSRE